MDILLPKRFDNGQVFEFLRYLNEIKAESKICTDYSMVEFVNPFSTLFLAIGIRDFMRYRFSRHLKTTSKGHNNKNPALTYLGHLGFFKYIGLDAGKEPNEAAGSERYLPITILNERQFRVEGLSLQDAIEKECYHLANIIYSGKDTVMQAEMLSYCLREVIRNVFEHAEIDECIILAQKWDTGFAEIAIVDRGIGLQKSISEAFEVSSPEESIRMAIQPGISSDQSPENDDKWQNSGYGLYVVSELGKKFGEFIIASDDRALIVKNGKQHWAEAPIRGTAVKLRVDTTEAEYWPNIFASIVREGEKLAESIPGAKKTGSKKSKMSDSMW